jgi:hypothetical protein
MTITSVAQIAGFLVPMSDMISYLLNHNINAKALNMAIEVMNGIDSIDEEELRKIANTQNKSERDQEIWDDFVGNTVICSFDGELLSSDPEGLRLYQRTHDQDEDEHGDFIPMLIVGMDTGYVIEIRGRKENNTEPDIETVMQKLEKVKTLTKKLSGLEKYSGTIKLYQSQNDCGCCS